MIGELVDPLKSLLNGLGQKKGIVAAQSGGRLIDALRRNRLVIAASELGANPDFLAKLHGR